MSDPATAYAALIAARLGHRRHNVGLRVAARAHVLDRPRWLDMAADMLAVPLDRPRDQVRAALADPERVRAALENAEPEGRSAMVSRAGGAP